MMKSDKGQMSLEYIVKLILVVVVMSVVIGMIITFKSDILKQWNVITNLDEDEPEPNAAYLELGAGFTAVQFANVIETCWAETRNSGESKVCFVVKGTPGGAVTEAAVRGALDPSINVDFTGATFGPTKDLYSVNHEIIKDMIYIKN